jgi:hypothetical protein
MRFDPQLFRFYLWVFMSANKSFSPAGAEPFYLAAGAEEEVVRRAVGFEPLGFGGQLGRIGSLGHEHDARAVD